MSITVTTILHCEHEDCKASERQTSEFAEPRALRKLAKSDGWSRVGGKDFCAQHKQHFKTVRVPVTPE